MKIEYHKIIHLISSRPDVFGDADVALRNLLIDWFNYDEWWKTRFFKVNAMNNGSFDHWAWDLYTTHLDFYATDINGNPVGIYIAPISGTFSRKILPPFTDLLQGSNKKGTGDPKSLIFIFLMSLSQMRMKQ